MHVSTLRRFVASVGTARWIRPKSLLVMTAERSLPISSLWVIDSSGWPHNYCQGLPTSLFPLRTLTRASVQGTSSPAGVGRTLPNIIQWLAWLQPVCPFLLASPLLVHCYPAEPYSRNYRASRFAFGPACRNVILGRFWRDKVGSLSGMFSESR